MVMNEATSICFVLLASRFVDIFPYVRPMQPSLLIYDQGFYAGFQGWSKHMRAMRQNSIPAQKIISDSINRWPFGLRLLGFS